MGVKADTLKVLSGDDDKAVIFIIIAQLSLRVKRLCLIIGS